jgi:16S rRNA (cytosine1402-N4)-methyltransferase
MKLSPDLPGPTAAELVNTLPVADLARLFRDAGESSRTARAMASAIGTARAQAPVTRSVHLAGIIARAVLSGGTRRGTSHPATRAFLALRAAVTGELTVLQQGLQAAVGCLAEHGRLCVLTYYGTEHALVRQEFRSLARGCTCPPELPVCGCGRQPLVRQLTPRPLSPSAREVARNESARSARLSVCERLAARSPGSGRRSPAH